MRGIAEYLGSTVQGLAYSEADDGNVFLDDLPTEPDIAVGVFDRGGDEASSKLPYDAPRVQIIVRGRTDPVPAIEMWQRIYSALHGLRNVTLPDGTYLAWCLATSSAPIRLDTDIAGQRRYGMNLRLEVINPTEQRGA